MLLDPSLRGLMFMDGGVTIAVLVSEVTDATVASLVGAGLDVRERIESASFVVGVAEIESLETLAALEFVRRIDPVTTSPG